MPLHRDRGKCNTKGNGASKKPKKNQKGKKSNHPDKKKKGKETNKEGVRRGNDLYLQTIWLS